MKREEIEGKKVKEKKKEKKIEIERSMEKKDEKKWKNFPLHIIGIFHENNFILSYLLF